MKRYTIRCPEHTLSDGRLMSIALPGLWHDDYEDAERMAQEQTAAHRQRNLDCEFEVVTDEQPLDLSPEDAWRAMEHGADVVSAVEAGLVTIGGLGREDIDRAAS